MIKKSKGFSFADAGGEQLVAYYGLQFAAAVADGSVDKEELSAIYELMDLSSLTAAQRETVHGYLVQPPDMRACLTQLASADEELRFAVAVGIIEVVLADGIISQEEEYFLRDSLQLLGVRLDQREMIQDFIVAAHRVAVRGIDDGRAQRIMEDVALGLKAVDIPIAAVHSSGSVVALTAANIRSGLAVLGFGDWMIARIGESMLAGVGMFIGKRKRKQLKSPDTEDQGEGDEDDEDRVVQNLHESIEALLDHIDTLKADGTAENMNEDELSELRRRLRKMATILQQKDAS